MTLAGALLGLQAGVSPGPLMALVIHETLARGARAGVKVALAPLFTDLPLIAIALVTLAPLRSHSAALAVLTLLGGAFLIGMGALELRAPTAVPNPTAQPPTHGSLRRGVIVNWLSPYPYLFWTGVGAPTILSAWAVSPVAAAAYPIAFLLCLVGAKAAIALLTHRFRDLLSTRLYRWARRLLALTLIAYGSGLLLRGAGNLWISSS